MAEASADQDMTSPYMAHAQDRTSTGAIDEFRQRMMAGRPAAAPPPEPPAAATPDPAFAAGRPRVYITTGIGEKIASVASDVGKGFVEAPGAVAKGIYNGAYNTVGALSSLGDWMNEHVADLRVPIPKTGSETIDKLLANPLSPDVLPSKLDKPESVTGNVVYEGARFLTGFGPALKGLGAVGVAGPRAVIAAGAASDFATQDPNAHNLASLIESVPALKNPVTEFLKADPHDNEALNRLRQAVDGVGFGVLTEGIVKGIRYLGSAKKTASEMELQAASHGKVDEAHSFLGDPSGELLIAAPPKLPAVETGVPDQIAAKGLAKGAAAAPQGEQMFVNFARINEPNDVKGVIREMANAFKGDIDRARRGVQSNDTTSRLADELGMTVEDLMARRAGQPLNAEESLAARQLLNASGEKLLEAAERASGPAASPVDLYNFRRMMAIHAGIQSEVIAARTETARALQAWSIPAGSGGVERAKQIQAMLDASGGAAVSSELAKRLATLRGQDLPAGAISNMVTRGWAATTIDAVKEAYVLGLLWSPTTHVVNSTSNLAVAFQAVYERAVASHVGDFLGTAVENKVVQGEAIAMTYGMISSIKDALRLGARALRTGETGASLGKTELPRESAISAAAISRELEHGAAEAAEFAATPMGRFVDFTGAVTGVPGRVLGASDEFFKTIAYRAEVHAQSLRQATQEGAVGPDRFRRMAELANDPPESIRLAAADAALYQTFQQKPGEWAQALLSLRNSGSYNPTFLVLPFIKTPANILRYTFERTPLAPLVKQWRDDVAAGGARKDLALARMATGTAIMATAMDLASSGLITGPGPSDPAQKEVLLRQGWQPNSIVVDGKYYSFNRLDPMGTLLAFAGAVAEKMKDKDSAPEDFDSWEEILASGIATVSTSVVDKSYFNGVSNVLTMIQGTEKGEGGVTRYVDQQTGSMIPMSSAFGAVKRFVDPVTREVNSPWDAIQAKIAGLSSNLPPARDLWGEVKKPAEVYGRAYNAVSPVAANERKVSPIDMEMERLDIGVKRIQKKSTFQGVDVNFRDYPDVYDEYVRLAGNELKSPAFGQGARDYLNAVVTGRSPMSSAYILGQDGPEGGRAAFIKNEIASFRKMAQEKIMETAEQKYPAFYAAIKKGQAEQQKASMPNVNGKVPFPNVGGPI